MKKKIVKNCGFTSLFSKLSYERLKRIHLSQSWVYVYYQLILLRVTTLRVYFLSWFMLKIKISNKLVILRLYDFVWKTISENIENCLATMRLRVYFLNFPEFNEVSRVSGLLEKPYVHWEKYFYSLKKPSVLRKSFWT